MTHYTETNYIRPMAMRTRYYDEEAWVRDLRGVLSLATVVAGFLILGVYFPTPESLMRGSVVLLAVTVIMAYIVTPLVVRLYRHRHPRNQLLPMRVLRRQRNSWLLTAALTAVLIAAAWATLAILRPRHFPQLDPSMLAAVMGPLLAASILVCAFVAYLYWRCILPNFGSENHVCQSPPRLDTIRIEIDGEWDEYREP